MEAIYRVPLHLKNKVKQIGYDEISRNHPFNWWVVITIISWIITAIVIYLWLFIPDLEANEIQWDKFSNEQIVEAIGKAENSVKYPYGIKSIDTKSNKEYARKICLNSVKNGRVRWIKAGKPDDLIIFIGLRYYPPKAHRLNSNWERNVKFFLHRVPEIAIK